MQRCPGCLFGVGAVFAPVFDLPVGALKDSQQFLVLFQRAAVGVGTAAPRAGVRFFVCGLSCRCQPTGQPAVHMGFGGNLVPFDHISGSVGTKYRIGGVFQITVGVIRRSGHDFLGVVARFVPGGQYGPAA